MGASGFLSRYGFTAWGVELARQIGMTLIGRAKGKRFLALAGENRILFDQNLAYVTGESQKQTKGRYMKRPDAGYCHGSVDESHP